jgi:phytoene dehydrogenase-like protein
MSDLRRFRGELEDRPDFMSSPLPSNLDEYHEQFLRHPLSARWQNMNFQAMLKEYINDGSLVRLMGKICSLLGGDPQTYPAYEGARLLVSLFLEGPAYPEKHFSHLTQKMSDMISRTGGEVITSCGAEEVLFKGEGVRATPLGLRLSDGSQIRSKVVILNIDPRRAATGLLQPSILGFSFIKEMEKLKTSPSAFLLHFIFKEDLRVPERVFLFPAKARRIRTGDTYIEVDSILLSKEKSTAQEGGCVLLARINVPNKCYHAFEDDAQSSELGAELTALIKREIGSVLPAVKNSKREFVTLPSHFARLTSNGQGAAFGFAPLLNQWYFRRPGPRLTPPNLYLVGAWSRYGGGLEGAALSGIIAARELCGEHPYTNHVKPVSAKRSASIEPEESEKKPAEKDKAGRSFLPRRRKNKNGGKEF